jgi:ADP-glucose pyrophosphorylase
MPHDDRRYAPPCAAVKAVYVAPAYTAGLDLNEHIQRAYLWNVDLAQTKISIVLKH